VILPSRIELIELAGELHYGLVGETGVIDRDAKPQTFLVKRQELMPLRQDPEQVCSLSTLVEAPQEHGAPIQGRALRWTQALLGPSPSKPATHLR
jgi:hypothetical protein